MAARKSADTDKPVGLFDKIRAEVEVPEPLVVTEDIVLQCPTKAQLDLSQLTGNELESNKILLGEDNYKKLAALFDDQPPQMWVEFNKAYVAHFFPSPTG